MRKPYPGDALGEAPHCGNGADAKQHCGQAHGPGSFAKQSGDQLGLQAVEIVVVHGIRRHHLIPGQAQMGLNGSNLVIPEGRVQAPDAQAKSQQQYCCEDLMIAV
ncbi:hypothetical protein LYNGBM3L_64080 [Moorena producens 3L]|uniref:Uncharacterized protein n=1 Tax=Moorena producens 3L TaxID=489825 RepID=F4XRA3_9CYAN|nr:hypothetical protein LYNGBM3L_64080 [Moorena producens 3L]